MSSPEPTLSSGLPDSDHYDLSIVVAFGHKLEMGVMLLNFFTFSLINK